MTFVSESELINRYRNDCVSSEGDVSHFYLDSRGHATIGRGHLVVKRKVNQNSEDMNLKDGMAKELSGYLYNSEANRAATAEEVKLDFDHVKRMTLNHLYKKHGAGFYESGTKLIMKPEEIERLWKSDVHKILITLYHKGKIYVEKYSYHPGLVFQQLPISLQLLLLDIAYNSGAGYVSGLKDSNPNYDIYDENFYPFMSAISNLDWSLMEEKLGLLNKYLKVPTERVKLRKKWLTAAEQEYNNDATGKEYVPVLQSHQTSAAKQVRNKSPLRRESEDTLGILKRCAKTNGHSRVPVPAGIPAPHRKSSLPHVGFEDVVAEPEGFDEPYLHLIAPTSDKFTVTSFSGDEGLSELFCYHIVAYSKNHHMVGNDLLSKSVTLQINNKYKIRYFNGDVYAFSAGEIQGEFRQYTLELRPRLWFLSHASNSRIFHNMSTKEIVKKICEEFHVSVDASRLYHPLKPRSYCVQYNETTLNFIRRLLEEEGIFYFFRHEKDKHTLVLADDWVVYKSIASSQSIELEDCRHNYKACVSKFTQMDYHYGAPSKKLDVSHLASKMLLDKKYEYRQSFGGYREQVVGEVLTRKRLEAEQIDQEWIAAHSKNPEVQPAYKFQIKNDSYVVVRMQHYAADRCHAKRKNKQTVRHYSNQIICIPANKTYRPSHITSKPQICGMIPAKVVGTGEVGQEVAVDQHGSVLVHFPWDREKKSSCRVRVAQSAAGNKHGLVFHPRMGDEVMVIFEEGDPDRPLIQGNQHNAENMPIYELASDHTKSGIKTKTVNGLGQNEIRFEDKNGAEEIYIHAQKDHIRIVEESEKVTVNKGNQIVKISSGKSVCEAANAIEFKVASNSVLINQDGIFINGQEVKINN